MVGYTDTAIAEERATGTELAIIAKTIDDIIYECAARHNISVPIPLLKKPNPFFSMPQRQKLYPMAQVNDFYDDSLLESDDVILDYSRLCCSLDESIKGADISNTKIDELFSPYEFTTHNFHPLAVVKYAMDRGFLIAECSGPFKADPPLCRRIKANGLWMVVPEKLYAEVKDYFRNKNSPTTGLCPVCSETMGLYMGMKKQLID
jgi:hypothetical protein